MYLMPHQHSCRHACCPEPTQAYPRQACQFTRLHSGETLQPQRPDQSSACRLHTALNTSGSYSLSLYLDGQTLGPSKVSPIPLTVSPGPCCSSCTLLTSQTPSPQTGQAFAFSFQLLDSFGNPCQPADPQGAGGGPWGSVAAPWGFAVAFKGPGGLSSWLAADRAAALGQYTGQYIPSAAGQYNVSVVPMHLVQVPQLSIAWCLVQRLNLPLPADQLLLLLLLLLLLMTKL